MKILFFLEELGCMQFKTYIYFFWKKKECCCFSIFKIGYLILKKHLKYKFTILNIKYERIKRCERSIINCIMVLKKYEK